MDFFDSLSPSDIVHNIKEIIHCPFCEADYEEKNIKILTKFEKGYVIHLFCSDCSNSIMASFSYRQDKKITSDKRLGDAKLGEMVQFVEKGSISDEDIMDFYKAIKDFDGDFKKLFSEKKSSNW